jgi:chromosome segregation ATPase
MGDHANQESQPSPSASDAAGQQIPESMQAAMARLNSGEVTGDDLMQVITEFDNGLRALKSLYSERQFLQAKLQQREVDFLVKENEISERAAEVEARRAAIDAETAALSAERADLESRAATLAQAKAAADQASRDVQHAAETTRLALEAREHELRGREEAAKRRAEDIENQRREIEVQRRAIEEGRAKAAQRETELGAATLRATAMEQELGKVREEAAAARRLADEKARSLEVIESKVGDLETRLKNTIEQAGQSESLVKGERDQLEQRVTELQRLLDESAQSLASERDRVKELSASLEHRTEESSGVEQVIDGLKQRLKSEVELRNEAEFHAEELGEQIEQLATQLQEAQSRIDSSDRAPSFGPSHAQDWLDRRRQRIKAARTAIRNKVAKLKKGEEAIQKRFEQCEQILSQRAELAAVHTAIVQQQRRLQSQQGKSRASVAVLCSTITIVLLAALSWAVSREVTPGLFVAKTAIRAEGRGGDMNTDSLKEWQAYHEKLLKDPRLAESIAGRMKKKNIESLSQPGAVSTRMRQDLNADSSRPGEIILELRGAGKQKTERELDTIATAFASEANASRDTRADGGITSVPTPATAGDGPIDSIQLLAAAGIMGAGVFLAFVLGLALWRRLAHAKTKFEQDVQLSSILDSAHWPDPSKPATETAKPLPQQRARKAA